MISILFVPSVDPHTHASLTDTQPTQHTHNTHNTAARSTTPTRVLTNTDIGKNPAWYDRLTGNDRHTCECGRLDLAAYCQRPRFPDEAHI